MSDTLVPTWTLSDRLRKARETAGYSSEGMAKLLGCARRSIVRWENGAEPKRMVLTAWAAHTGVPVEWLEHGDVVDAGDDVDGLPTGRYEGRWSFAA